MVPAGLHIYECSEQRGLILQTLRQLGALVTVGDFDNIKHRAQESCISKYLEIQPPNIYPYFFKQKYLLLM